MQLRACFVLSVVVGCTPAPQERAPVGTSTAAPTATAGSPGAAPPIATVSATALSSPPAAPSSTVVPGEPLGSNVSNKPTTSSSNVPDADRVIVGLRPKFKECYDTVRGNGPHIAGMVTCSLRIAKDGKVAAVSLSRRDRLPPPLVECLMSTLKGALFQPLSQDEIVIVPVRFEVPDDG